MATLKIENRKAFDEAVWQTETGFVTEDYNEWLQKTAAPALQKIYDYLGGDTHAIPDASDQYVLGDVINMLNNITVDAEPKYETWNITRDDFETSMDYDMSRFDDDEEKFEEMLTVAGDIYKNHPYASDLFVDVITTVADEYGLRKKIEENESFADYALRVATDDELSGLSTMLDKCQRTSDYGTIIEDWMDDKDLPYCQDTGLSPEEVDTIIEWYNNDK